MSESAAPANLHLGFLTVLSDSSGWFGGYLVTNSWGRPLEFRLSTAVQPNKVQVALYGPTLTEYLFADIIGKTLIEKTNIVAHLIITDSPLLLPLRSRIAQPTVALSGSADAPPHDWTVHPLTTGRSKHPLLWTPRCGDSEETLSALLERVDGSLDLAEPFARIREALAEARKMGVTRAGSVAAA